MANMSAVMEKTLSSLPGLLMSAVNSQDSYQNEFKKFMKSVENVKSKQEEERVILKHIASLKEKLANPQITNVQRRQSLTEVLFCFMLGYDVAFSYIHAVKLAQQGKLLEKRTGYLLCSIFMNETHELSVLLINTILKDLKSSDVLVVGTALSAACQLVSCEMIPAVLPLVEEKLNHSNASVRKKAVMCVHQFYRQAAELVQSSEPLFIKALCDKDPSVMWAAVYFYLDLIKTRGAPAYRKLVGVFTDILMQIVSRKLPTVYDHKSVPAPWLSITLLRILGLLGHQCESTSMQIYPVLREVSQRTEPNHTIGLAVISECVETICTIYPETSLLQFASKVVAKFLSAQNINIRYIGLRALSLLVSVDLKYTIDHQKAVIEFLDHEDLTIQRQTFQLLFRMANPKNIAVITKKLLDCLKQSSDRYLQNDIVAKVLSLTQRYNNDDDYVNCTDWYLNTINELLATKEGNLPDNLVSSVMDVLDHKPTGTLQTATHVYWDLLQTQHLTDSLVELACWVVSSHFSCNADLNSVQVSSCLLSWLPRTSSSDTQRVILMGLSRLMPRLPQEQIPLFVESIEAALHSSTRETLQMVKELKVLAGTPNILAAVTNGIQKEKMDFSLSFLDDYVCECLENGDSPYKPTSYRTPKPLQLPDPSIMKPLRLTPYESPVLSSVSSGHSMSVASSAAKSTDSTDSSSLSDLQLKGVKRVWGKEGFRHDSTQPSTKPEKDMSDEKHEPSNEKTKEEIRQEEFATALFSGIDSSGKASTNTGSCETSGAKAGSTLNMYDSPSHAKYTQLNDAAEAAAHLNNLAHDRASTRHSNTKPTLHLEHSPERNSLNFSDLRLHSANIACSRVIRDVAFDTDSLDGSLDLDAPPMLFHSEHEDLVGNSSRADTSPNSEQLFSNSEEKS